MLWDLKQKVGHATRTVDECLKQARSDMTIRTTLTEARLITGDRKLLETLLDALRQGDRRQDRAGIRRRQARRARGAREAGGRIPLPCRAQHQGGQGRPARPQHAFLDLEIRLSRAEPARPDRGRRVLAARVRPVPALRGVSVVGALPIAFSRRAGRGAPQFRRAATDRPPARLFDSCRSGRRRALHEALFSGRQGCRRSDGDRLRRARGAPDQADARVRPVHRTASPAHARDRRRQGLQGRRTTASTSCAPMFSSAIRSTSFGFSGSPSGQICRSTPTRRGSSRSRSSASTPGCARTPRPTACFLEILTSRHAPETALRRMNEAGVLGRFIPEFGRVVGMMQFSMYHHYTVDEHLIRTVGALSAIDAGRLKDDHPLSTEFIHKITHRTELYLAAFLHDIAKGRPTDHSKTGARGRAQALPAFRSFSRKHRARRVARRAASRHVQHGAGSRSFGSAHRRSAGGDRADAGAAQAAAHPDGVPISAQSARACGTAGRASCCAPSIGRPRSCSAAAIRRWTARPAFKAAQETLRRALPGWSDPEFEAYAQRHYPAYWLKVEAERQVAHAKLLHAMAADVRSLATEVTVDSISWRHGRHRRRARPPEAPQRHCRGVRSGRRQHRRRADLHHDRRSRARYDLRFTGVRAGRGRIAAWPAHRHEHRKGPARRNPVGRDRAGQGDAGRSTRRIRHRARSHDRQHAIQPPHGRGGVRARPAWPAARPHRVVIQPQSEHRIGPYRDLRREGGRRVLRHRSDGTENQFGGQAGGRSNDACWRTSRSSADGSVEQFESKRA